MRIRLLIFVAILAYASQCALGQSTPTTAVVIDLRHYGWQPTNQHDVVRPSLAVDHKGRVLVGFTHRERFGLVSRTQPSLEFHILRFTPDGKVEKSLSLPTNAGGIAGIYLSAEDQIIAMANDSLQLLQTGGVDPKKAVWKMIDDCSASCHVLLQSPSRNTLFLYTEDANSPVTIIRLARKPELQQCGQARQPRGATGSSENEFQNYPQFITDKFAYFEGETAGLQQFTYRWPLCDFNHRVALAAHPPGSWIGLNDRFFVSFVYETRKNRSGVEVLSFDGHIQFRPNMSKHESAGTLWTRISGSEQGNRIAVDLLTIRGANRTLDISGHVTARRIAVYDIEAKKEVASIPVHPNHRYGFAFALSPDGHRLAILEDSNLRMFNLDQVGEKTVEANGRGPDDLSKPTKGSGPDDVFKPH